VPLTRAGRWCMEPAEIGGRGLVGQGDPVIFGTPAVPFKCHAEHRHHIPKRRYRVTNWPEYDAALRRRGSLTVWITDEAIAAWRAAPRTTPGGQPYYSAMGDHHGTDNAGGLPPGLAANRGAHWFRHRATGTHTHRAGSFDDEPPKQNAATAATSPTRNRSAPRHRAQYGTQTRRGRRVAG
jgi:hypothetical protein